MKDKQTIEIVRDDFLERLDKLAINDDDRRELVRDISTLLKDTVNYNISTQVLKRFTHFNNSK